MLLIYNTDLISIYSVRFCSKERRFVIVMLERNEALLISIVRFMGLALSWIVSKNSHVPLTHSSCQPLLTFLFISWASEPFTRILVSVNTPYKTSPVSLYFHIYIIQFVHFTGMFYVEGAVFLLLSSSSNTTRATAVTWSRLFDTDQNID